MVRILVCTIAVLLALASPGAAGEDETEKRATRAAAAMEQGRNLTALFFGDSLDEIFAVFSDEMKREVSRDELGEIRSTVQERYGAETELLREKIAEKQQYTAYYRHAKFGKSPSVVEIVWYLREDDKVAGFFVKPINPQVSPGQP